MGRWPVDAGKIGLFTQALAGGDRGCGAICDRWCEQAIGVLPARVKTPAPQLEVVRRKKGNDG